MGKASFGLQFKLRADTIESKLSWMVNLHLLFEPLLKSIFVTNNIITLGGGGHYVPPPDMKIVGGTQGIPPESKT